MFFILPPGVSFLPSAIINFFGSPALREHISNISCHDDHSRQGRERSYSQGCIDSFRLQVQGIRSRDCITSQEFQKNHWHVVTARQIHAGHFTHPPGLDLLGVRACCSPRADGAGGRLALVSANSGTTQIQRKNLLNGGFIFGTCVTQPLCNTQLPSMPHAPYGI